MVNTDYNIKATANPLGISDLYAGRTVYICDTANAENTVDVNNIGILELAKNIPNATWIVIIKDTKQLYNEYGYNLLYIIEGTQEDKARLYGIEAKNKIDIDTSSTVTRGDGEEVTKTTMSSLIPKDEFAIAAMQAIIPTIPNTISMDDATIYSLAVKSYKIAEAMINIGTLARSADGKEKESSDSVPIDTNNLGSNNDKILYNILESIKDNNKHLKDLVTVINSIPSINVNSMPTLNVNSID